MTTRSEAQMATGSTLTGDASPTPSGGTCASFRTRLTKQRDKEYPAPGYLPADYALPVDGKFAAAERHGTASSGAACPAPSSSCTGVVLPTAPPARSQVHARGGHTERGNDRRPPGRLVVQVRFRAARNATRHGYRSGHDGDADHVTCRIRHGARTRRLLASSARSNPAMNAARAAPRLPMLPPSGCR
jgi:hypothetical protein